MIAKNTRQILNDNNTVAKKFYGQNFLTSENILEKICDEAELNKEDNVLEIGVGLGALTEYLVKRTNKVLCYEIDEDMYNICSNNLKDYDNKKIILGDFLKRNVMADIKEYFGNDTKIKVVANLPYYVTTKIMIKLFELDCITKEVFMVQKEMADRFIGDVRTKDYNALTVYVKYFSDPKVAFLVSKNNFYPMPEVDSAVLSLTINKKDLDIKNEKTFLKFVKESFAHRRKTFANNISDSYHLKKKEIEELLLKLGFNTNVRSEELDLYDFAKIYKELFKG